MAIIQSISAVLTDAARHIIARSLAEGITLGDWSFQVGTGGFNLLDPTLAEPVDSSLQNLLAPVGTEMPLGRSLLSGGAASAALTAEPGVIQIDGLSAIPLSAVTKWLTISGAGSPTLNGSWVVRQVLSATSVLVNAPLVTAPDAGPLSWELRESVTLRPNSSAVCFHGRLPETSAADGLELGEVAIYCRVLRAPADPSLEGSSYLFANSHHPAMAKNSQMSVNYYVCVQI